MSEKNFKHRDPEPSIDEEKRDFLFITTTGLAVAGGAVAAFSLIDTTSLEHAKHFKLKGNGDFETIKVKNFHINDIFNKVGKINVLNIDIEGKDFEVIKSSNLEIIDPEIILIEDNSGYFPLSELTDFFSKKNYHLISICGLTKCFAKR